MPIETEVKCGLLFRETCFAFLLQHLWVSSVFIRKL